MSTGTGNGGDEETIGKSASELIEEQDVPRVGGETSQEATQKAADEQKEKSQSQPSQPAPSPSSSQS